MEIEMYGVIMRLRIYMENKIDGDVRACKMSITSVPLKWQINVDQMNIKKNYTMSTHIESLIKRK